MHPNAVSKRPFIQVAQPERFRQVEDGRRMDGRLGHVEVLRLVHVHQQVIDVVSGSGPELAHRMEQRNQGASQVAAYHWPPQHPRAEISDGQMVVLRLPFAGMRRSRDVELSCRPGMQLIPPLNRPRRIGRKAVEHQKLFNQREASGRQQSRKGQLEGRPTLGVALGVQVDEAVAVSFPYLGILQASKRLETWSVGAHGQSRA